MADVKLDWLKLAWIALGQRDKITRLVSLLQPAFAALQPNLSEISSVVGELMTAFGIVPATATTMRAARPPDDGVRALQAMLKQAGYYQGEIDGLFGPQTKAAVLAMTNDIVGRAA